MMRVVIAGVPVEAVVDTALDITIIRAEVFKHIGSVAKLRQRHLKPVGKTTHTYDQKTFHLDGWLDMDITFDRQTMTTPICQDGCQRAVAYLRRSLSPAQHSQVS